MQLTEGHIVAEHYKLIRQLGHGSFGDVWLAHNLLADIDVAVKFYGTLDEKGLEEFRNEFKIAYKLHHPNLLNINHFDVFENCPYLVMPYCENGSVSRQIGQMAESEIWKFVLDVSGGLAFLHGQQPPIVHQDIKPDNILITSDGRYVISDFGISRSFRTQMSRTNNNISSSGTIAYMGPERFSEKPMVVLASDIWAFGMTLYELMTGDVLWEGMGGCVQLNGARLPVINGAFSHELKQLVTSCLAAETWNRPTAAQIHDYAAAWIQKRTLPPLPVQEAPHPVHDTPRPIPQTSVTPNSSPYPKAYPSHQPAHESRQSLGQSHQSVQQSSPEPSWFQDIFGSKLTLKRGLLSAAALLAAIALLTGIVSFIRSMSEEDAFVSCRTLQDYEQFIRDYPSSQYISKAKERITALSPAAEPAQSAAVKAATAKPDAKPDKPHSDAKPATLYITEKPRQEKAPAPAAPSAAPQQAPQPIAASKQASADNQAFYSCRTTKDYHAYLSNFPNGRHRKAAEDQLTLLLNETNANEVNLNSAPVPANAVSSGGGSGMRTTMPQRTTTRQVGFSTGRVGGGYRAGGSYHYGGQGGARGSQRSSSQRSGGSSHRHSN